MRSITLQNQKKKVIHILEVIGNAGFGGMENYLINFFKHIPASEFDITCICPYESAFTTSLRELGIQTYITPIAEDSSWRSIQLAVEIARLHNIDVFHAHMANAHILAGLAGSLTNKPVVATIHGMDFSSCELGIARAAESHLITNCQEAYAQVLAMGIAAKQVSLVHNGVDTKLFSPEGDRTEFRKRIGLDENVPLVAFAGRLDEEKGPDLFLRAAHYVHFRRPDIHYAIVGNGTMKDELKKMCKLFGLKKHVHFIDWQRDMANVYRSLDILVHTSRSDGTSLVLLEAMACATPVVAIAVGGVREIVEEKVTGLIAGREDWEAVGCLILELFSNVNWMKSIGSAARKRVQKKFDVATNTEKVANILRQAALISQNSINIPQDSAEDVPFDIEAQKTTGSAS
jgi:glycosyltransferase involved in cell wall biosynthesis